MFSIKRESADTYDASQFESLEVNRILKTEDEHLINVDCNTTKSEPDEYLEDHKMLTVAYVKDEPIASYTLNCNTVYSYHPENGDEKPLDDETGKQKEFCENGDLRCTPEKKLNNCH